MPYHLFIKDLLLKYEIGIGQLTPISWFHVFTFIDVCELKGFNPTFNAFVHMHYLSKNSRCQWGWYQLANGSEYMTAIFKPNKAHSWKGDFVWIFANLQKYIQDFARWNRGPSYIWKDFDLPVLTNDEHKILEIV